MIFAAVKKPLLSLQTRRRRKLRRGPDVTATEAGHVIANCIFFACILRRTATSSAFGRCAGPCFVCNSQSLDIGCAGRDLEPRWDGRHPRCYAAVASGLLRAGKSRVTSATLLPMRRWLAGSPLSYFSLQGCRFCRCQNIISRTPCPTDPFHAVSENCYIGA